jgi:hypothetical protein
MTRKTASRQLAALPADGRPRSARKIEESIRGIRPSDEPAVVLSSLARSSNPSFSDACAVELSEGTQPHFRVRFPMPDDDAPAACPDACAPPATGKTIITPFQAGSGHGYASFAGVIVHSWAEREPTEDDAIIARLLVDLALAIVQRERFAQTAARADDRAANLAFELITGRLERRAGRRRPDKTISPGKRA